MQTHVQTVGAPLAGAGYQIGTLTHAGRDFSRGGGVVDVDGGHIVGYLIEHPCGDKPGNAHPTHQIVLWDGTVLADVYRVHSWWNSTPVPRNDRQRRYAFSFRFRGYAWHAIGQGIGMIARARRGKAVRA